MIMVMFFLYRGTLKHLKHDRCGMSALRELFPINNCLKIIYSKPSHMSRVHFSQLGYSFKGTDKNVHSVHLLPENMFDFRCSLLYFCTNLIKLK